MTSHRWVHTMDDEASSTVWLALFSGRGGSNVNMWCSRERLTPYIYMGCRVYVISSLRQLYALFTLYTIYRSITLTHDVTVSTGTILHTIGHRRLPRTLHTYDKEKHGRER